MDVKVYGWNINYMWCWVEFIGVDGGFRLAHGVTLQCTPPRPFYSFRQKGATPTGETPSLPLTVEYRHNTTAPSTFRTSCLEFIFLIHKCLNNILSL